MSNALAVQSNDLIIFDEKKLNLIRTTIAKDLEPMEFDFFMAVARARGLDPILNQIHAVKRKDKKSGNFKMTIQVGIDGFRLIASRTGEYAGCDEPSFEMDDKGPFKCRFTVYRLVKGVRCAFTATARWEEYCPTGDMDFMWRKMPETMLSKVCEALALRKAFPADLSGLYVDEEMHQADAKPVASIPTHQGPRDVSPKPEAEKPAAKTAAIESTAPAAPQGLDGGDHVIGGGQYQGYRLEDLREDLGPERYGEYFDYLKDNGQQLWAHNAVRAARQFAHSRRHQAEMLAKQTLVDIISPNPDDWVYFPEDEQGGNVMQDGKGGR